MASVIVKVVRELLSCAVDNDYRRDNVNPVQRINQARRAPRMVRRGGHRLRSTVAYRIDAKARLHAREVRRLTLW